MSSLVISGFMEKGGLLSRLIRSSLFVMWFMKYLCQGKKRELFSFIIVHSCLYWCYLRPLEDFFCRNLLKPHVHFVTVCLDSFTIHLSTDLGAWDISEIELENSLAH